MARNYAALPHDYLRELDMLTDEEFGRLCRGLLRYSATGEIPETTGGERYVMGMVLGREDRYQKSYEAAAEKRSESARRAANARWEAKEQPDENDADACGRMPADADGCDRMRSDAQDANNNTDTETKTDTETENKTENKTETTGVCHTQRAGAGVFVPPTEEQVGRYCAERGYGMDAGEFFRSYAAKGWMMGSTPMRSWRAAADMWEHNRKKMPPRTGGKYADRFAPAEPLSQGLSRAENDRALSQMAAMMREMRREGGRA